MRVQRFLPLNNWQAAGVAAERAEALGYDGVVTAEIANDPFTPLAFAAVATRRIRLGTAIAVAFPRSPMIVANLAWDLQAQSGGRFELGLGSQVKGHNVRRFSTAWSPPVPRLREYVRALRAIWRCWEKKEPLHFEGEHYRFTLMTPEFSPPPSGQPPVPISIAAVGPAMMRLAGQECDGVKLHGFATRKFLEEEALPRVAEGLSRSSRPRESFEISGGGFVATGATAEELSAAIELVRYRVAFYGSTRSYHGVFRAHGWDELGDKLHQMSKRGEWKQMAAEVPDEVVHTFAAVGTYPELRDRIEERFGGLTDSIGVDFPPGTDEGLVHELLEDIQKIDSPFDDFPREWEESTRP